MPERVKVQVDPEWGWIVNRPTYHQIVETFGEILIEEKEVDYQGDSLYLIKRGHRYGVLTFGWGSCSGCDALEACDDQEDINHLQNDLERGIKWFDFLYEVTEYLLDGGLKDSYLNDQLVLNFGAQVVKLDEY